MYTFANDSQSDVEALLARVARMDDRTLERLGKAAAYMCSPEAHWGEDPREVFILQLREAREEWRRRREPRKPMDKTELD